MSIWSSWFGEPELKGTSDEHDRGEGHEVNIDVATTGWNRLIRLAIYDFDDPQNNADAYLTHAQALTVARAITESVEVSRQRHPEPS